MTTAAPFIKGGKLKALAQTGARRVKAFAHPPPVAAQGLPASQAGIWFGLVGPAKMPAGLVARINGDLNRVLAMPDVAARLEEFGAQGAGRTPQPLQALL